MQQVSTPNAAQNRAAERIPEARYAYYRRCQVFRKGGEQCKAPAEKGAHICHAHAGQLAMAVRRERERQAVLLEAVAQMRRRGKPDCEMADLFMDFKGINMTLAVMAQAVISGRIDCKTAGRLVVQLQTVSKLLQVYHRGHRDAQRTTTALTTKDTRSTPPLQARGRSGQAAEHKERNTFPRINHAWGGGPALSDEKGTDGNEVRAGEKSAANEREETRIILVAKMLAVADGRSWAHAPPELLRAA